jgi:hypothetical protein
VLHSFGKAPVKKLARRDLSMDAAREKNHKGKGSIKRE